MILPKTPVCPEYLINNVGNFSLSLDLASLFQYFGSFIIGEGTIMSKWAEFTTSISRSQGCLIPREKVLDLLSRTPDTERQVSEAQRFYHQMLEDSQGIECVWSGETIKQHNKLHIDHVLPFSLWKNNDFWNLMPTLDSVNSKKKDAIPSPKLLEMRRGVIEFYWRSLADVYDTTFRSEIVGALTGQDVGSGTDWMPIAFKNLVEKSRYLIDVRGCQAWCL